MKTEQIVRVRFAPSPTGMMHLGNVRIALMNYLFAQQKGGTFIIRIEDTDPQRNFDPGAIGILNDLSWLELTYQEGPLVGGPHMPYFQSERGPIYQKQLDALKEKNLIYRCFCSPEELERKRKRQLALKMPPRYDRTCLNLDQATINKNLADKVPFIWRMKLDSDKQLQIHDLAHGTIHFDLKNFSDFPLTRADGSCTFIFANFVDDMLMEITHVIRGEDHLTNSACQAALYLAFEKEIPTFWHLPILCNAQGKKLSKRDFGFSLMDLRNAGFLPQAIDNYLAIIGGGTFAQEIMSLDELTAAMNFEQVKSTGQVRYDVEKLKWVNHQWITRLSPEDLYQACLPFLRKDYPDIEMIDPQRIMKALSLLKSDFHTLEQAGQAIGFILGEPVITQDSFASCIGNDLSALVMLLKQHPFTGNAPQWIATLKAQAKKEGVSMSHLFWFIRIALIGKPHGPSLIELIELIGDNHSQERLKNALALCQ